MHVADFNGRIHDRQKRENVEALKFGLCWIAFLVAIFVCCIW